MVHKGGYKNSDTQVKKLFDINSKQLVEGSQEELLEIYNQEFKGAGKKKIMSKYRI